MQNTLILLLLLHFTADQLIQFSYVQKHKSISSIMLLSHVITWTIPLYIFAIITYAKTGNVNIIWAWPLFMAIAHFSIEFILGRWAGHFFDKGSKKGFLFVSLLEHTAIMILLIVTFQYTLKL